MRTALLASLLFGPTSIALAQEGGEDEEAGHSRGGYAWGEAPEQDSSSPSSPGYRRFGTAFARAGVGFGIRLLTRRDGDYCEDGNGANPDCRLSPPYFQMRGGWFFEGTGDFQHGLGLGVATNLGQEGVIGRVGMTDVTYALASGNQWTLAPTYHARYVLGPWFQLAGHFGVPLSFASFWIPTSLGATQFEFNWGLELELNAIVKFTQGLGVYAGANMAVFFGRDSNAWPTLSLEAGVVFEYEVLP